jgi:hypothetical protein
LGFVMSVYDSVTEPGFYDEVTLKFAKKR